MHGGYAHASVDVPGGYFCFFFNALHCPLFAFTAMFSSESVMSNNPVLNVLTNLSGDMESDSIVDVSIQRVESPLEPSTCSSQSLRCSQMSCFQADKSITMLFFFFFVNLFRVECENRLSESANQTCLISLAAFSGLYPWCLFVQHVWL